MKDGDVVDITRFVFITGVSKFSQVSIFSELNNLTDLTMLSIYSDMFGYTMDELDHYLMPYIELMAEKIGEKVEKVMGTLISHYNKRCQGDALHL
ncbi:MAG: AAA family ATPase [Desulfamplus sp.]|nr:AAA family ATPase [Desulfamplus sp.]